MPSAPQVVLDLVDRFERNRDTYKFPSYNETQVRREFIDPFFKSLGWDIDNERGYAEAYKDVVHEDAIKVGEGTKAPDYCFRIGGTRKFFLEAKKPSKIVLKETRSLPFCPLDLKNKTEKLRHDQIVGLVDQMLTLHKRLPSAKAPQDKTSLERQITATDAQIDRLVYELYSLTPDEIQIVEGTQTATAAK